MLNQIEEHTQTSKLQEIMNSFEFQIALLGGSGVGKTSLIHKIINNYMNNDDEGHQQ